MPGSSGLRARVELNLGLALTAVACLTAGGASEARAQDGKDNAVARRGSENIEMVAHLPLGGGFTVTDVEIEQELLRPYAYLSRAFGDAGFDVLDLADPKRPRVIYSWRIENADLHRGYGGMDPKYFKHDGRYYLVQSLQFAQGSPDADVGAVVVDVTDLPDPSRVEEVGRIRVPDRPGGFHNIFMYKHSDGRPLLFTTTQGPTVHVYDMGRFVDGDEEGALVAEIALPDNPVANAGLGRAYHDFFAGYHPESDQDRFYAGGVGGYFVFDISELEAPRLLASVVGVSGVTRGHTITPTPDGRYIVTETEYQYAPLRLFDLKPGLDGEVAAIRLPISAWTANWENLSHNHEIRWPYVFVSAYEDGLQIFNMRDPQNPHTVAFYDTYDGPHKVGLCSDRVCNGAFGVDVRNADGLIVVSDSETGFWAFRWEGFEGWNGHDWGMPNISSVQDWENGP